MSKRSIACVIKFMLVVMFLTWLCMAGLHAQVKTLPAGSIAVHSRDRVEDKLWLDDMVSRVGAKANSLLYDVDGDGVVWCIDHSIAFKRAWDIVLDDSRCALLVWHHSRRFNHMCVAVRRSATSKVWYLIEPQATMKQPGTRVYMMADFWPATKYNSLYNEYDRNSWLWTMALNDDWPDLQ